MSYTMPTLQEKVLPVKLFYLNQQNSVSAVKEFHRMKRIRRGPMSPCALRKMIQKFETTGQLGILPGRGRKQIPSSSVEDVNTAVVEARSQSPHGSASAPVVSRVLDIPYSTVRKILRQILNFFPTKAKPVHLFQDGDSEIRITFELEFHARTVVDVTSPWNILWNDKPTFASIGTLTPAIVEFGQRKTLTLPLHPNKLTVWCDFTATFITEPYFFEEITANGIQKCSVTGQRTVIC
ncbi:hypothetical protein AVEN_251779-1 [Araneus ventricosus]|uniref:DUF4817 domain-containing protein n=1 Tax=Araneus ventricosus TaxID=182803 RepID=A0A4Y2N9W9_ARAVE|nr:hypothetical protein AVEN_251779-1 [Araneus ventricosus]